MKINLNAALSSVALFALAAPAAAQHHGHHIPAPTEQPSAPQQEQSAPADQPHAHHPPAAPPPATQPHAEHSPAAPASATQPHAEHSPAVPTATQPHAGHAPADHSQMDHTMHGQPVPVDAGPAEEIHAHSGALGPYSMNREASGTSWQPDAAEHMGAMSQSGDWMLMGHGVLNLVYDHQSGPRGDDKAFVSGMLMGMARRPIGNGALQFRAALSPDPLMGKRGYPLLLASGETADGVEHLIDRQHPHDFFMELSTSISQNIGPKSSVFLYAGLPGEPAFGPPAFMHREAIMDSPEAPITHHWLDSTHITMGVLTAGLVLDRLKLEVSRFNGREPDQHRWNLETGPLDSTAVRLSWNPTDNLSLQGSWGHFEEPEQLEPGVDQRRWSASAIYAREVSPGWKFAGTLAWGRKSVEHHGERWRDDAYVAEATLKHAAWTLFGRGEITENRELLHDAHGTVFRVGKVSVGALRDFRIADHVTLGAGGLFAVNFVPDTLAGDYGGQNPTGAMAFVRLKLN